MPFRVVTFINENSVECVPTSWIFKKGKEMRCYWPFISKNINKKIASEELPDKEQWIHHACKIMGRNEYSDYKDARIAAKRAEVSSNIESSAEEGEKRTHKSPDRFSPSKESSNSGDDNTDVERDSGKRKKGTTLPKAPAFNVEKEPSVLQALEPIPGPSGLQTRESIPGPSGLQSIESIPGPPGHQTRESIPGPSGLQDRESIPRPSGLEARESIPGPSGLQSRESITRPSGLQARESIPGPSGLQLLKSNPGISVQQEIGTSRQDTLLTQVLETVVDIKTTIDKIAKAVIKDERKEDIQALSISDLVPSPLDTKEELIKLDEKIVEDQEFKSNLIIVLAKLCGGPDLPPIVRTIIRALLTNKLMSMYSLTGQKGKTAFRETKCYKIIIRAIKRATKDKYAMQVLNFEVAEVLRNAPNHPGGKNFVKKHGTKRKRQTLPDMHLSSDDSA